MRLTTYECDHEKNVGCPKDCCQKECFATTRLEFAKLDEDGQPIVHEVWEMPDRSDDGMILYDYSGEPHEFDVDLDDEEIAVARLEVVSGDEVLEVIYKDGEIKTFDAGLWTRLVDFHDDTFILVCGGKWVVDKERFLSRKGSYDDWNG